MTTMVRVEGLRCGGREMMMVLVLPASRAGQGSDAHLANWSAMESNAGAPPALEAAMVLLPSSSIMPA